MDVPAESTNASPAWHALDMDDALQHLSTTLDGLDQEEAQRRAATHGPNVLSAAKGTPAWKRLAQQFNNVLIYVLVGAGVVTAFMQHWTDTAVIFGVVVVNALIGFIQEGKAEKALDAIRNMLSPQATVLRGGQRMTVDASVLVPGDMVFVQSGDRVPADIRLARVKNLQVQEAALTGESEPVEKNTTPTDPNTALADRRCMAFAGTLVSAGQGLGVVVATAGQTEIGRISAMLADVQTLETPLLRQMAQFSKWLTGAILAIAGLTFAFGVLVRDYLPGDMFIGAVGLAVAAIPEGLPAIMTITLAIGVQRMAGRNAIIRKLPAVETLGSVTVVCSDKTGTLTRNEMTAQSIATSRNLYTVTGAGYAPSGTFYLGDEEVDLDKRPLLLDMARAALLCSDARVNRASDGTWNVDGDPTEGALVVLAAKAGLDLDFETKAYPRTDVIPFESEHQFMATLHHDHAGNGYIFVKGAPERIFQMCTQQHDYGQDVPLDKAYWLRRMEEISSRGQRVLALARRRTHADHRELLFSDVTSDLVLTGLIGLADPPRSEALSAVALCHQAGIRVKMITGDHPGTAAAIGREIGLHTPDKVLRGVEIDDLDDAELARRVPDVDVFARTTPEHKLRLVTALQSNGEVVAMTGDGVNDAPALKRADVGVAMGKNGTEAAKEAAEMVLADDNFASISSAIEEGRTVYDNLIKAITFILPTNGAEALVIIAAIALGYSLPITPLQILWVNMTTAVTLALALAFEPPEPGVMLRPPRDPRKPILSPFLIWRIVFVALICVLGTFGLFLWELERGASLEFARSVAVNTLVLFEAFYLFNTRYLFASSFNLRGVLGSRLALLAVLIVVTFQVCFVYLQPMQMLFGTTSLDILAWLRSAGVASTVFFLVEVEKWAANRLGLTPRPTEREAPPQPNGA